MGFWAQRWDYNMIYLQIAELFFSLVIVYCLYNNHKYIEYLHQRISEMGTDIYNLTLKRKFEDNKKEYEEQNKKEEEFKKYRFDVGEIDLGIDK